HGRTRARSVLLHDRGEYLAMLADGDGPEAGCVEVVLEAQEERPRTLVPQRAHDERERAVAARLRDAQVELAVRRERHHLAVAIGRKAPARAVLAFVDEGRDLVRDLSVESAGLDGLEGRHLVKWSDQFQGTLARRSRMANRLKGKRALVTAAGQGMGRAAVL